MGRLPERLAFSGSDAEATAAAASSESNTVRANIEAMKKALEAASGGQGPQQLQQLKQSGMNAIEAARQQFGSL